MGGSSVVSQHQVETGPARMPIRKSLSAGREPIGSDAGQHSMAYCVEVLGFLRCGVVDEHHWLCVCRELFDCLPARTSGSIRCHPTPREQHRTAVQPGLAEGRCCRVVAHWTVSVTVVVVLGGTRRASNRDGVGASWGATSSVATTVATATAATCNKHPLTKQQEHEAVAQQFSAL